MSIDNTGGSDDQVITRPGDAGADAGNASDQQNAPEPIKLTNESLVHIEGSEKPVKLSDYTRGFQSQFTKASQELARARQALQEREQEIQRYRTQSQQQPQSNQPQGDPLADLKQLPYLTGAETADLVSSIHQQVKQRDQYLIAALKEIKELRQIVGGLHQSHSDTSFKSMISKVCDDLGYGPEAHEVAEEIYLAYTGDDLNAEFPRLLGERMVQLEKMFEARKAAARQRANAPFVPGRGGNTGPSNPLKLHGSASAADVAEAIWKRRGGSET